MKEPPSKKYLDHILQNSALTRRAKKIFINPTSNKVSRLNSLCYTIAIDCNFPFLKPEDRDILLHQLDVHFTPKEKTDVITNQYVHDQYFLSVINDPVIAIPLAEHIKQGLPSFKLVDQYCMKLARMFDLNPLEKVEHTATLINMLHGYYNRKSEPITTKEPATMSNNAPKFETKHFVNGTDAKHLSDAELITAIKDIEKEIAQLQEVKTASKKISAKITELDAAREAIAALLDQR